MLHVIAQSNVVAATGSTISNDLPIGDRRVRRLATSVLLHGADERDGGTTPAHGGATHHDRQRRVAARTRSHRGDGMWTRSRRDRGMLDVFYPGTSVTLAMPARIAASRH